MSLFSLPRPTTLPVSPVAVGSPAPGRPHGPPAPRDMARTLEHTVGFDGSRLRERWGSPMQFQPADALPDVQARELVNHLLEQRNV